MDADYPNSQGHEPIAHDGRGHPIYEYDEQGKPVFGFNDLGKPICNGRKLHLSRNRKHRGGEFCLRQKRMANGRCPAHGGKMKKPSTTGEYTKEKRGRERMLNLLENTKGKEPESETPFLEAVSNGIRHHVDAKNPSILTWSFDQFAGKPPDVYLPDGKDWDMICEETSAFFLERDDETGYHEWLTRTTARLEQGE